MAPNQSHLSDPKYLYDVVVSTTQESINDGLVAYLQNTQGKQPVMELYFLVDDDGVPSITTTLSDLMAQTGGISPWDIPAGTVYSDPRIAKFNDAGFYCAIRLQMGIPPGCVVPGPPPHLQLPQPIVTLTSATNVTFNMYCATVAIVKNSPPYFGKKGGSWKWFTQPSGTPWYIQTQTNLMVSALDSELNTTYFDNHPDQRAAILAQLKNTSGTAFSLQQLLFDLDNAAVQTVPTFEGIDDQGVVTILGSTFVKTWAANAKEYGAPLISVSAVPLVPDNGSLTIKALERWVSPVVDPNTGVAPSNPTPTQLSATTLNYLCATETNTLPGAASFNWNWVEPQNINDASGVMAIKRSTFAQYLCDSIINTSNPNDSVKSACILPWTKVVAKDVVGTVEYQWSFEQFQDPTVTITPDGPIVAHIDYHAEARSHDSDAATYGELNNTSTYSCSIMFGSTDNSVTPPKWIGGNTVTIVQNLKINVYVQWSHTGTGSNVVDTTLTDVYAISVDNHGNLAMTPTGATVRTDNGKGPDVSGIVNAFTGVGDLISDVKSQSGNLLSADIKTISFNQIQSFVFPGAQVFSYAGASFSNWQDLCCLITYVNPTDKLLKTQQVQASRTNLMKIATPQAMVQESLPPPAAYINSLNSYSSLERAKASRYWDNIMAGSNQSPSEISARSPHNFKTATAGVAPSKKLHQIAGSTVNGAVNGTPNGVKHDGSLGTKPLPKQKSAKANGVTSVDPSTMSLTADTNLIQNYVQGEIVAPTGKFRALQTSDGDALLFAVTTDGVLNVIDENLGRTKTGWTVTDLSSSTVSKALPSGAVVRQFDVGQSAMNSNTISLGMSVRANNSDMLFLSLQNSPTDTASWISGPQWQQFPFDAADAPSSIQITNIYFSETEQNIQYILVDILRDPKSSLKDVVRYIVDPYLAKGPYWQAHKLPFDVEDGTYQSCVGRVSGAFVDGIYTSGTVAGAGQLGYVPLFNLSGGSSAPLPTRLLLPGRIPATSIACARNDSTISGSYGTTDLYAIGGSTLYRWASDEQMDDDTLGKPLMTNDVLGGTNMLVALSKDQVTTIFGKNASNVVFYTSCPADRLSDPSAWSPPLPILSGIERITSYINVTDGGNTVFAAGGNKIQQLIQATNTSSKIWQAQAVTVAAPPQSKSIPFKSYTTTIQVVDQDGIGVSDIEIELTTPSRTPVYIGGLYYVLSSTPVNITTDGAGKIVVAQATNGVVGAVITVNMNDTTITINPMDNSVQALGNLNSVGALKNATITTNTVAGGFVGPRQTAPFVDSSRADQSFVDDLTLLQNAYKDTASTSSLSKRALHVNAVSGLGGIVMAAGDLFRWLETGVDKAVQFIKSETSRFVDFVVTIAGKVYRATLDTVEAVAGAFVWLFDVIETGIEKVIQYLEILFEWDDIRRSKDIMHNMIKLSLQNTVQGIKELESEFDGAIAGAQQAVARFTGITDWHSLGDSATQPVTKNAAPVSKTQAPGSDMLINHFQNQADQTTGLDGVPKPNILTKLLDDLIDALVAEGEVLSETIDQLSALANDFMKLSLGDILLRLAGILVESVLGSAQVVIDALFNILYDLASSAIDTLDTKIHIPIISDILDAIGVPELSILDVLAWICALSTTVVYKIANGGNAPFPDNDTSKKLIAATDWNTFVTVANAPPVKSSRSAKALLASQSSAGRALHLFGHGFSGLIYGFGNFLFFPEVMEPSGANPMRVWCGTLNIIATVTSTSADLFAPTPGVGIKEPSVKAIALSTSAVQILSTIFFMGPVQDEIEAAVSGGKLSFLKVTDARQTGALVNTVLCLPLVCCSSVHLADLAEDSASAERSGAIVNETSKLVGCVSKTLYYVSVKTDIKFRPIPAGIMVGANVANLGLQWAVAYLP